MNEDHGLPLLPEHVARETARKWQGRCMCCGVQWEEGTAYPLWSKMENKVVNSIMESCSFATFLRRYAGLDGHDIDKLKAAGIRRGHDFYCDFNLKIHCKNCGSTVYLLFRKEKHYSRRIVLDEFRLRNVIKTGKLPEECL